MSRSYTVCVVGNFASDGLVTRLVGDNDS
jgi:hypothetical protein